MQTQLVGSEAGQVLSSPENQIIISTKRGRPKGKTSPKKKKNVEIVVEQIDTMADLQTIEAEVWQRDCIFPINF